MSLDRLADDGCPHVEPRSDNPNGRNPGEVWGNPDDPASWRLVVYVKLSGHTTYRNFLCYGACTGLVWEEWVNETGAVCVSALLAGRHVDGAHAAADFSEEL